jgi:branched-chain amino acid transport system ATP-binding protein
MSAVLDARGISVSFGGVRAVQEVDLQVEPHRLVGLIGPNGAGKTTFIDAITGFVSCRGTVALNGEDVSKQSAHARARRGLARTWQSIELFDDLTVAENLTVASYRPTLMGTMRELLARSPDHSEETREALGRFGLQEFHDAMPADLAQGQRKLVGVARALAANPGLVCLDEPAAGLDTNESIELGRKLRAVVDDGMAMLLIDHDMGLVLGISDYVYVLEFGKLIAQGKPEEVRRNPKVVEAYLGQGASELAAGPS